jgi:hypothetical protein
MAGCEEVAWLREARMPPLSHVQTYTNVCPTGEKGGVAEFHIDW